MWEKQLCRPKGQCRRRGWKCSRRRGTDSPAARGADPGEAGCALQPMEAHGGADLYLQPRDDPTPEQGDVTPWGARAGAGSWQDLWPRGERSPRWNRFAGRACDPVGDPRWSSLFLKDCTPWEGPTLGQFVEDCLLWEGPTLEQGQSVRKKERQSQRVLNWPQTPFPVPLCCLGGVGREFGSEAEPGRKGGVGERALSLSVSRPTSLSSCFLSPVRRWRGVMERLGGHPPPSQAKPPH